MLIIPQQYTSLKYIRSITWKEIFDSWRNLEAWQESWREHWTERGFDSWDEWRHAYANPLHPKTCAWELYRVTDPLKDIPLFFGTPTKGWIEKAYQGETTRLLKDISDLPIVTENKKILDIKQNFPKETMLTGITGNGNIILIEGMHRALAITTWNDSIPFSGKITLALAEWTESIPTLGGNCKKKTLFEQSLID